MLTEDEGNGFPEITVYSRDPADSGQSSSTDYIATYSVDLAAKFEKWPSLSPYRYSATKEASQPLLTFKMQDRCLGMSFLPVQV